MLISLNWLNDYVDLKGLTSKEIAKTLTNLGLEVESISPSVSYNNDIIVGKIKESHPHPQAEKLVVCDVDIGEKTPATIVCGAPNAKAGITVAVAKKGAELPDGSKIKASKIRGIASNGMMCSERELGISDDHDGIIEIKNTEAKLGMPISTVITAPDTVLDVSLTPNRADCLSYIGIARDLSAKLGRALKSPSTNYTWTGEKNPINLKVENADDCPRFCCAVLSGVKTTPSPTWIKERLKASGLRPKNLLVDISNYVMLEYGQPNHIYDRNDVYNDTLKVIKAKDSFELTTLDESKVKLKSSDLMIADDKNYIGLAGVMGAQNSEVKDDTNEVVIEVASFNPSIIRKTSKRLAIHTDASHRFERGVDTQALPLVVDRICSLIEQELKIHDPSIKPRRSVISEYYPTVINPTRIALRLSRAKAVLGMSHLTIDLCTKHLESLGCRLIDKSQDRLFFEIPFWRQDIIREIDLIEEVARIEGYDKIPYTQEKVSFNPCQEKNLVSFFDMSKQSFASSGFNEVMTYPFLSSKDYERLNILNNHVLYPSVELLNPLVEDERHMQTTQVPGLLKALFKNRNNGIKGSKLFEVGRGSFSKNHLNKFNDNLAQLINKSSQLISDKARNEKERIIEHVWLSGLIDQPFASQSWSQKESESNFHKLKSLVLTSINRLCFNAQLKFEKAKAEELPFLHPGAQAWIKTLDNKVIGWLGELHPQVMLNWHLDPKVPVLFELDLEALLELSYEKPQNLKLPGKFPSATRDLAFIINESISYEEFSQSIKDYTKLKYLTKFSLFDVYRGKPLSEEQKSFALTFYFQSESKTLSDKEVELEVSQIINYLNKSIGAELR